MTCKGICIRHKAQKPVGSGRYASGQKRCQICEIFIKWDGLWCPCCGYRLRTKPRNLKYKAKLRERKRRELRVRELAHPVLKTTVKTKPKNKIGLTNKFGSTAV
ncbi:MAG: hypothetical protein E6K85_03785 [Thaumarchaeota archaeon]|nr:MAG: hypothetical protein E6K85_03785 [Nitrososphaerota archaeon]